MVQKSVLKKIGIFMLTAVLAAAPIMAVNAESAGQMARAAGGTGDTTSDPGPNTQDPRPTTSGNSTSKPVAAPAAPSVSATAYVVTNAAGQKLVSTVPGVYSATCVPGVAITTPASELPKGMTVEVRNSARGPMAAQSIQDGLTILAQSGVSAVKGPELDVSAYIQGANKSDLDGKVTMCIGIPAEFKQAGYDYAVMLVQVGGRVSILPNTLSDPELIAVNTKGFGVYVLVKAPAGSFKMFQ